MINLINVSKTISGNNILSNINLEFKEGECVWLRGHNGCGKTMLLRMLCGLIRPSEGEVTCDQEYRYGVIIESPSFFPFETAMYNLKYLAAINKLVTENTILEYLETLNLTSVKNKKVRTFSLGMKQRLAICQAFMENPDVVLLDEPFNAVDDDNLKVICNLINDFKNKGKIVVIASHGDIPVGCSIDRTIQMSAGKIV